MTKYCYINIVTQNSMKDYEFFTIFHFHQHQGGSTDVHLATVHI